MQKTILFYLLLCTNFLSAQNFDKNFYSFWGETFWEFHFLKNGTFTRTSVGHYGNTEVKGEYVLKSDTITILKGYKNTHGTISEKYAFDFESKMIDTKLLYEYEEMEPGEKRSTFSKINRKLITAIKTDTLNRSTSFKYYGNEKTYFDKTYAIDQVFYFLNSVHILDQLNSEQIIYLTGENDIYKTPEKMFDDNGRLKDVYYIGSSVSGILPHGYHFDYDDAAKIKNITNRPDILFLFEYDNDDNLVKVIKKIKDRTEYTIVLNK